MPGYAAKGFFGSRLSVLLKTALAMLIAYTIFSFALMRGLTLYLVSGA